MSYYDEWVDDYFPRKLASKLRTAGFESYTSYMYKPVSAFSFLTPKELETLRKLWKSCHSNRFEMYPFLRDENWFVGEGI
jgi:hypothetical protein